MKVGRAERGSRRIVGLGALGLALALTGGCSLDEVTIPPFDGPSTNALSVVLTANPDWLKADGASTSVITATLRDTQGRAVSGRGLLLTTTDVWGEIVALGALGTDRMVTGTDGRARVVYTAPASKEMAANTDVLVWARPEGSDASGEFFRGVRIQLVAVDKRQYREPGTTHPVAQYLTEPRHGPFFVGVPIHFQSTSYAQSGTYLTQYEWHWDDGTNNFEYGPEKYHTFTAVGTYFVFHSVIDNFGGFDSTNNQIDVEAAP
jgi:hypothetical protein